MNTRQQIFRIICTMINQLYKLNPNCVTTMLILVKVLKSNQFFLGCTIVSNIYNHGIIKNINMITIGKSILLISDYFS